MIKGREWTKSWERLSLEPYQDPPGSDGWSIGWGHYCGKAKPDPCTKVQADAWFDENYREAIELAQHRFPGFDSLAENRKVALIDMMYEVPICAIWKASDYFREWMKTGDLKTLIRAACEYIDSKWHDHDAPTRAGADVTLLLIGDEKEG